MHVQQKPKSKKQQSMRSSDQGRGGKVYNEIGGGLQGGAPATGALGLGREMDAQHGKRRWCADWGCP